MVHFRKGAAVSPRPRSVSDEDVLKATLRAISRVGPAALTLADVAREAGIAPPTLIQRFGSKRGLLLAFAERGSEGVRGAFAVSRAAVDSPIEAMTEALVRMTRGMRTRRSAAHHLAFLQMDLTDPEFHEHARAHARLLESEVARSLKEAVRRGEIRVSAAETSRLAKAVHSMYNGALLTWAIQGGGTIGAAIREAVGTLLERYRTTSP